MNFLTDIGANLLQGGLAVASGKSVGGVAKQMVTRKHTRKLESYFMQAADAYSSGYSTFNAPSITKFGVSAIVALAAWTTVVLLQKNKTDSDDGVVAMESPKFKAPAMAGAAAFLAAFFSVMAFDVVRRQKTFSNFTGTNMILQHAVFFAVPFAVLSAGLAVASPLDVKKSVLAATFVAVGVVVLAKKFYFVFKQNDLEKEVFTQIANVLDACQSPNKAGCSHRHAGYLEAFSNMVKPYIDQVNYLLPSPLDASAVARDIASRQIFDTLRNRV